MSAQHHRSRSRPSAKAEIESLIALGKTGPEIMAATGMSRAWVTKLISYHNGSPRDHTPTADCDAHLALVAATGHGFPFYPYMTAKYRMRS